MNNEHGAFFDIDYLLASSLMDVEQKTLVANTVRGNNEERSNKTSTVIGHAREFPEVPPLASGVNSHQLASKSSSFHQFTQRSSKNDEMKRFGKSSEKLASFAYETGDHVETYQDHHQMENIKQEAVDDQFQQTQVEAMNDKAYKDIANRDELSDEEFLKEIQADRQINRRKDGVVANGDEQMRAHESGQDFYNLQSKEGNRETSRDRFSNGASENKKHELEIDGNPSIDFKKMKTHVIENGDDSVVDPNYSSFEVSNTVGLEVSSANDVDVGWKAQKEFVCSFQPCTKSFSSKSSLSVHERKFHDRPAMKKGRRSKKEIEASNFDSSPRESLLQQITEPDSETFPSELNYPRFPNFPDSEPPRSNSQPTEKDFKAELKPEPTASSSSFLTDTNLGFDEGPNPGPDEENLSQTDASVDMTDFDKNEEDQEHENTRKPAIDISSSKYFTKNPNVIANARGKSVKLFDEEASDLPEGWKMRSIEVNSKTGGGVSTIKHYLSPDTKVLKTGLSVIEYLRLEGVIGTDKILEIAQKLNVSEKKIRNLYNI